MRIKSIRFPGLKDSDGTPVPLDPCVLVLGDNESGKSTITDAVRLLLTGEHPAANRGGTPAKTNDAILTLTSGDRIEVEGVIETPDGDHTIGRSWWRTVQIRGSKAGTVQTSSAVWIIYPGGRRIDALAAAKLAITDLVGHAVGLDSAVLLGPKVTDTERLRRLLAAVGSRSSWTPETVAAELKRRKIAGNVEPWLGGPKSPALVDWLTVQHARYGAEKTGEVARAHGEVQRAREAAEAIQQGQLEGEQAAIDPVVVQAAQQAVLDAEALARSVEAQCTRSTISARASADRGEQLAATRRRAAAKLATVREQIVQARQGGEESPRIAELILSLEDAEDELQEGSLPALHARRETIRAEVDRLQGLATEAAEAEIKAQRAVDRAGEAQRAATKAAESHRQGSAAEISNVCHDERTALRRAKLAAEPARVLLQTVSDLLEDAEDLLEDSATCPTCGGLVDSSRLDALGRAAVEAEAPAIEAAEALKAAEVRARSAGAARHVELVAALDTARHAEAEAKARLAPLAKETSDLLYARQEAQGQVRALDGALGRARDVAAAWREELAAARASSAGSEVATLQERERALQAEVTGIHVPDLGGLRQALDHAEAQARRERRSAADQLANARTALQPLEAALTLQREVLRLRGEVTRWEEAWREAQRIEGELGPAGMMGAVLDECCMPLEGTVNEGLAGLGLGIFAIKRLDSRGNPVFRPGLQQGAAFVPIETLTGGQTATVKPLFIAAVANLIGSGLRIVLDDEVESISHNRLGGYLGGMVRLVGSDRVDQVLIAGCPHLPPQVAGCTVIQVEK